MRTALLISTYNWPAALELIFKSLAAQTRMPDEILIADDGSKEETAALIRSFSSTTTVPVKHFWQEDKGFRKSMILNKTVAGSSADYIIQIDGDCIMHSSFVEDHINAAQQGVYLYGSRINILPAAVTKVFKDGIISFNFFSKEIKNKTRTLHIPLLAKMQKAHEGHSRKFRGCNVSYWKADFIAVNGYNEDFEGWGREDSDLAIRMGNNGVLAKRLKHAGIVYHIYHEIKSKENLELNDQLQNKTITEKTVFIKNGVDKYVGGEA